MPLVLEDLNLASARQRSRWGICITLVLVIAPVSVAVADQVSSTVAEPASRSMQAPAIDPITGLAYGAQSTVSGVAMAVDADGHPRAMCADPADSLAPLKMRDAIEPAISRLRYE